MENSMAKSMAERYEDYLDTTNLEERAVKNIYYWVMSIVEFLFWGSGRRECTTMDLYANNQKMVLICNEPTGQMHQFVYTSTHRCDEGELPVRLQEFVKIFNNIDWHHPQVFRANYFKKLDNEEFHRVSFHIDMHPGTDEPAHYDIA